VGSPRVDVVFLLWQCDKENHGWREGRPLTVAAKFRSETGLHPPGKVSSERKKNIAFCQFEANRPYSQHWPVNLRHPEVMPASGVVAT